MVGASSSNDEGSMGGMSLRRELDLGGAGDMQMQGGPGEEFGEAALGSVIQPPPTAGAHDISRVSQLGNLPAGDEFPPPDAFGGAEASLDAGPRGRARIGASSGRPGLHLCQRSSWCSGPR